MNRLSRLKDYCVCVKRPLTVRGADWTAQLIKELAVNPSPIN